MKASKYLSLGIIVLVFLLAGAQCVPAPAPQVIEKEVIETVIVEKEVETEKVVVVTATPMPEAAMDQYGGTLVTAQDQDPFQLDPLKDPGSTGNTVIQTSQIVESLIGLDRDGNPTPQLAADMPEISDDGLTFTFKLREGVKFHDGTDFNAEAVKYNWLKMIDPNHGVEWGRFSELYGPDSIEVLDDYTISITFNRVYPDFLWEMAAYPTWNINSPTAMEELGEDYGGVQGVVGTGPFKWKEWVPGDRIVVAKNEDYWEEGLPYLDEIVYKTITDPSVKLINLQAGTVDLIFSLPFQFIEAMDQDPDVDVLMHGSGINEFIFLNNGHPALGDPRVRKALSLAIDRDTLNELLFEGIGEVPNSPFPGWHWANPTDIPPLEYDPDQARALLAEAGYDESNPLQIEIRATNQPLFVDQAALVQSMWAEVGVQSEILPLDKAAFWDPILISGGERDPVEYGKFEAGLEDFGGGAPIVSSYVETQYMPYMGENATCYNEEGCFQNPEVMELIEQTKVTVDPEELQKLFHEITVLLREDIPYIQLMWLPNVNAVRTKVEDYNIFSQNSMPLKYVWLSEK